ncbi:hypothetical protein A2851_02785 [Candidatus Kaiserbacteria bacterium RIFCSPHIGHO2_01_FULL_53_29]|uniref:Uncharacterized protein n=1 Tax=Candidatus Kaiserbacteria bacterium RIFCSPHIGHO2_01_FULL_53_29 TaxID=1798480 RepID=A0A1F6CWG6_9BACT|nr:MAG: hypothetical protein A2851_02785 [Candidatus Kaiserbacteria bacterium RIFCSPHIGHO2_01_FULL_53_29]
MAGGFIGEYEQQDIITTADIRGVLKEFFGGDLHHFVDGFIGNYSGISRCLLLSMMFFGLLGVLSRQIPNLPLFAFEWLLGTSPIWIPILMLVTAWKVWVWYSRGMFFFHKVKPILYEVKMPRDIFRSPRAMENALSTWWSDAGETTPLNRVWQGQVRPWHSLEIASFGGEIHFYIWGWRNWKQSIEAAMYAFYPEVELVEVEDYASKFKFDPKVHEIYATDWRLEPRNDAYPFKTYVDFELDKDPKEEYRVDPLAPVLERMSNLEPFEQMWLQIVITMNKDQRRKKGGSWMESEGRYQGMLKETVEEIRKETTAIDPHNGPDKWKTYARVQLFRYNELIKAIDRNMGKHPFSVGVRGTYITNAATFSSARWTGHKWIWRPFGNPQFANQLRPRRWHTPFDYPWQDYKDIRWNLHARRFFDAYKRRSFFYSPWIFPHNMMSSEMVATLWHPPSAAVTAPGLERIAAKKAEPPSNLPK